MGLLIRDAILMRKDLTLKLALSLSFIANSFEAAFASGEYGVTVDHAVRAMCNKPIVMLGESSHGDGKTTTIKVALTKKLIAECGFSAVYFEAGIYDFLDINNRLNASEPVTLEMVATSMGWIRSQYTEIAPLIPFLHQAASEGRVSLGGLDDQLGSRGAHYSLDQMLTDISSFLSTDKKQACYTRLKQWVWSDYPANAPYTIKDRSFLDRCLADIDSAIDSEAGTASDYNQSILAMVASFRRALARSFTDPKTYAPKRDHSMYLNFEWLKSKLPSSSKIIVWSVNSHIARKPSTAQEFQEGRNFGSYISKKYGDGAFALGFSAAGGSYRWSSTMNKPVPNAALDSVEANALAETTTSTVYVGNTFLRKIGKKPGSVFMHDVSVDDWSNVFNGIIVLQEEQPLTVIGKRD